MQDTIAAISSPPGEGAVALIRISGPQARTILGEIFFPTGGVDGMEARRAAFGEIREGGGVVDQALCVVFPAPASYTGEDMVEIGCHGGILLAAHILELVFKAGARAADPGEFTQRAFFNGKLDLTRAEAVMDIIRARTPLALRSAAEQLQGRLGKDVAEIRLHLLQIVAHVEAWIDFPEEGIDPATGAELMRKISAVSARISAWLATADDGRILREGVRVAIVGRPNSGKSSLLNRLLGMERAIVSPVPGTTRDTIEEAACLRGILFRLTDTAGLRETAEPVEREGIARARRAIEQADLVLHVVDADGESGGWRMEDGELKVPPLCEREILVANKVDLLAPGTAMPPQAVRVSCLTGEGMPLLVDAMIRETCGEHLAAGQSLAAVNARHKTLLASAASALDAATGLVRENASPELTALELRAALDSVGRIIGAVDTEEILGEIFRAFCIGK